jgi:hypothetical protein
MYQNKQLFMHSASLFIIVPLPLKSGNQYAKILENYYLINSILSTIIR